MDSDWECLFCCGRIEGQSPVESYKISWTCGLTRHSQWNIEKAFYYSHNPVVNSLLLTCGTTIHAVHLDCDGREELSLKNTYSYFYCSFSFNSAVIHLQEANGCSYRISMDIIQCVWVKATLFYWIEYEHTRIQQDCLAMHRDTYGIRWSSTYITSTKTVNAQYVWQYLQNGFIDSVDTVAAMDSNSNWSPMYVIGNYRCLIPCMKCTWSFPFKHRQWIRTYIHVLYAYNIN